MSWSPVYLASLAGPRRFTVLVGPPAFPAAVTTIGPEELTGSLVSSGGSLRPRSWETVAMSLPIGVAGTRQRLAELREACPPGSDVRLLMATEGGEEVVFWGRLREIVTVGPASCVFEVDGPEVFAQAQYNPTDWRDGLFEGQCDTTTIGPGSYTPGSGAVPVGSSMAAALMPDGDGSGGELALAKISGPDGDFWVSWTAMGGGYLTERRVEWVPPGSAASVCAAGTAVAVGPLVQGPPWRTVLRVLRGGSSGGLYADLPAGLGLSSALVDAADAQRVSNAMRAVGHSYVAFFGFTEAPSEPEGAGLLQWAASQGLWLVQRQGQLTLRCALDPWDAMAWGEFNVGEVTDADIVAVGRHTTRHPDMLPEHAGVRAYSGDYSASGAAVYLAVLDSPIASGARTTPRQRPASTEWLDLGHPAGSEVPPVCATTDATAGRADAVAEDWRRRLAPYAARIVEVAEVTLTARWLRLCAGDLVSVTSRALPGPSATGGVAAGRRAVVVPQAQDWSAGTVDVVLWFVSEV